MIKKFISNPRQSLWRASKQVEGLVKDIDTTFHQKIGVAGLPKLVSLPVIAQCNYRCSFCEINGVDGYLKTIGKKYQRNQMSVEQVLQFEKQIRHAKDIDFGGQTALGEPFLSSNFIDVLKAVRKLNRRAVVRITTNGRLMTPDIVDVLLQNGPLYITFSLHAATEEVYSKVMGNGFDKVIQNIRYFSQKAAGRHNISSVFNYGLGKFNYQDADKIVSLARELNIRTVHMYPYYKSPNKFMDDVSLYANPDLANHALESAYKLAAKLGQKMSPEQPAYIQPYEEISEKESTYMGGCRAPYEDLIMKSTPTLENKISFGVCNRIVLFVAELNMEIDPSDMKWMWHHPALEALRHSDEIPSICKFCKNPSTASLRSLDYEEYKRRRDAAVKEHLSKWQTDKVSPSGSIELLAENIFSLE